MALIVTPILLGDQIMDGKLSVHVAHMEETWCRLW